MAKQIQAQLITLTHNLLLLYEQDLEKRHGIRNEAEDRRREQRTQTATKACAQAGKPLSTLVSQARRSTQRSVKFIRWVRQSIRDGTAEPVAVLRLQAFYAAL